MQTDKDICKKLETDGIVIIPNAIEPLELTQLQNAYNTGWNEIKLHWNRIKWHKIKFNNHCQTKTGFIGKDLYDGKLLGKYSEVSITDMGNCRYDFTYGLEKIKLESKIINNVMKTMLECEFEYYLGGLPLEQTKQNNSKGDKGGNGRWHRDAYSLFDNQEIDLLLKPFYYTVIIPLDKMDIESGRSTEFIKGSHKLNLEALGIDNLDKLNTWCDNQNNSKINLICNKGDICIFHGYVSHRGIDNLVNFDKKHTRILYAVFKKNWYNDEPENNYSLEIINIKEN
jgi:hypothetical protein